MKHKKLYSFWHYAGHFFLSSLLLFILLATGVLLPKASFFDTGLKLTEQTVFIDGVASRKASFDDHTVKGQIPFFSQETFSVKEKSSALFSVSDFVQARFDENTVVEVLSTTPSVFFLKEGKGWISSKEYAAFEAPRIRAETLSGKMMVESRNGKTALFAVEKPLKITLFEDEERTKMVWEFFLPAHHRMIFDKNMRINSEELDMLRFSKIQKEFLVEKWDPEKDAFFAKNIAEDEKWRIQVLQKITNKANDFQLSRISASLFQFMPQKEGNDEMKQKTTEEAWRFLEKKDFTALENAISHSVEIHEWEKIQFRKYVGFFEKDKKALPLFFESLSAVDPVWKGFWQYESLLFADDTGTEQSKIFHQIFPLIEKTPEFFDRYEFLVSSFFKNYPSTISASTIGFLDALDKKLIENETTETEKALRKVEIVENIFSFIAFLVKEEEFLMAKAMIQNADFYLESSKEETLSHVKRRILEEKENIENRLAFSQIGGGSEQAFWEFVANKQKAEEIREKLHASASEQKEFSVEQAEKMLAEFGIKEASITQDATASHFFKIVSARNSNGVIFSASFNADKKQMLTLIIHKNGEEIRSLMGYPFTLDEISALNMEMLSQKSVVVEDSGSAENRPIIASEIVDMVFLIAQRDFIALQVMVLHKNLIVTSAHTVTVKEAVPFFDEEAEKKKKTSKKKIPEEKSAHEKFTLDFEYDTDTKLVKNAVARQQDLIIHLDEESTLQDAIFSLEKEIIRQKERKEKADQARSHFLSNGFAVEKNDTAFTLSEDGKTVSFSSIKHSETGFLFSGQYDPENFMVKSLIIENLGNGPRSFGNDIVFQEFVETLKKFTEQTKKQQEKKTSEKMLNL